MSIAMPKPKPLQNRSQARVETILETAKELLIELGYEDLNIQKLAKKANIQAPSIYRYFPNKRAIIATFADVFRDGQFQVIDYCLELKLRGSSWQDVMRNFMFLLSKILIDEKWIAPAHLAIRLDRGLKDRHERLLDEIAERFVLLLRSFNIQLSDEQFFTKARMLVLILDAYMLALERVEPEEYIRIQKEFEEVVFAFLRTHIPAP